MKKRVATKLLICLGLLCAASFGSTAAEEGQTDEVQTEAEPETETETEAAVAGLPEDGVLFYDLENEAKGAFYLVEEDGKTVVSFGDDEEAETEPETEAVPEDAGETEDSAEPELLLFETPETFYVTTALYMRARPDVKSKIMQILKIEQPLIVYAKMGEKWYLAGTEKGYGFVAAKYLTDSAEEAEQAMKAEKAARAAAERAAQAAAAQAAQQAASQQAAQQKAPSGKTVVRRENIPNCDDASHGMTYITYSDGSMDVVEY